MVVLGFCPQCGSQKIGRFCPGCGLNLDELQLALASLGIESPRMKSGAEVDIAPIPPVQTGPEGLVYGEDFDPSVHCLNCGSVLDDGVCGLCSQG